jgi:hypothetical protein
MRVFIANRASGEQARVNVRCLVNSAEIRREKRNGRDVVIVPSATMPDDVVMNGILYPAAEIAKSFKSLERTPAPLGHPEVNGKFVSASDPEGLNQSWIGAWNENVRQEKGRVRLDKVIDVEIANRSEGGKAVLSAIDKGSPVHTSTGLLCILDAANGDVEHNFTARDIVFDHDAILLDEEGAATPEQGVGMMVNASGQEIEVINCSLAEDADRDLDWALDSAFRALEKRARVPLLERFKTAVIEAFSGSERSPSTNKQENDMAVSDEQFKALSDEVKTLSDGMKGLGDTIATAVGNAVTAAVKPLVDAQAEIANAQKAKDEDELKGLREKIVKANLMEEAEAGELTLNAARALAKKAEPGHAAAVNGAFKPNGATRDAYKLPEAKEA